MREPPSRPLHVQFEGETTATERRVRAPHGTGPGCEVLVLVADVWVTAYALTPNGRSAYVLFLTLKKREPPFRY